MYWAGAAWSFPNLCNMMRRPGIWNHCKMNSIWRPISVKVKGNVISLWSKKETTFLMKRQNVFFSNKDIILFQIYVALFFQSSNGLPEKCIFNHITVMLQCYCFCEWKIKSCSIKSFMRIIITFGRLYLIKIKLIYTNFLLYVHKNTNHIKSTYIFYDEWIVMKTIVCLIWLSCSHHSCRIHNMNKWWGSSKNDKIVLNSFPESNIAMNALRLWQDPFTMMN